MANIFAQYMQPVRGLNDRMADMDAQDYRREQLAGAKQQNALQALAMRRQMEAEESGRQQQQRFAGYLQQSGGDVNALQKLLSADPAMFDRAQGLAKELMEREKIGAQTKQAQAAATKSEVDADKDRLAMARTKADAVLQAVSAAKDPVSYQQAIQWLGSQGIDTSSIPQQFDPKFVQTAGQQALTVKDRADQEWKAKGYDLEVKRVAETGRHNRAQEGLTASRDARADARARETNTLQRDAARVQVIETPDGVMLVDKGTGEARPAMVGGKAMPGKQPESVKKELLSINQQRSAIDGALREVEKTPTAFGFARGTATRLGGTAETLAGRMDTDDQIQARSFVYNNVSKIINERAGAAQSAQELSRLRGFLPAEQDDARQVAAKLRGFKEYLNEIEKGTNSKPSQQGVQQSSGQTADLSGFKIIGVK